MKTLSAFLVIILLAFTTGCSSTLEPGDETILDDRFFEQGESLSITEMELGVKSLVTGRFGPKSGLEVVHTQDAFDKFWVDLFQGFSNPPEKPDIDFTSAMVAAAFMGSQPSSGYSIDIEKAVLKDGVIGLQIQEYEPGAGCFNLAVITAPFHLVQIEYTGPEEVRSRVERTVFSCSE